MSTVLTHQAGSSRINVLHMRSSRYLLKQTNCHYNILTQPGLLHIHSKSVLVRELYASRKAPYLVISI